jgi:hypothetical protein
MRQDDTRRLLVTITKLLVFVLAALTLVMWRWPERLRGMIFGAEPENPSVPWDGWGWLALGWFALVVVAALLFPTVGKPPRPATTAPSLCTRRSPAYTRAASTRDHTTATHGWGAAASETSVTR